MVGLDEFYAAMAHEVNQRSFWWAAYGSYLLARAVVFP